jgi:putative peptidoglycan lipid II flippase
MGEKRNVTKAAGLMSTGTLTSRILGFVRDVILARVFGATGFTDAFFVAYRIPNLLRELFAEGSVSAGYVPVFTEYLTQEGKEEAKKLAGVALGFLFSVLLVICFIGILAAPYIIRVIAPNFVNYPEQFSLTVKLLRIMFPFLIFISLGALAMGTLNSLRVFFIPSLAPAFFNLVMIASALFIAPEFTVPIVAIAMGVTLGGLVQYAVQIPALSKKGFNVMPRLSLSHSGLKKILLLVLPVVAATGVMHINVLISNVFATYLQAGSVTYLYYGYRLILFPIGIFGISVGMAMLPSMSEQAVKGDMDGLRDTLSFSMRLVLFTSIPAMAGLIALAEPIVNTLFQRGEFTYEATKGTVYALVFYSIGIWAFSGLRVVRAAFYSLKDTKTPLKVATLTVFINLLFCYVLIGPLKHGGLALALTLSAAVNFVLLSFMLRSKLGNIDGRRILNSLIRILIASLIMSGIAWSAAGRYAWTGSGDIMQKAAILTGIIILCVAVYLSAMYLLKSDELKYLINLRKVKAEGRRIK